MPMTNAERQARYRERLRIAAAKVPHMHIVMVDLILQTRRNIRTWKRSLSKYEAGQMRIYDNNKNVTSEAIANNKRMIAENSSLLAQYDPSDVITDGNVELGEIPATTAVQIWPDRFVSYAVNAEGLAEGLRLWDADSVAQTDAASYPERRWGQIAEDGWSIVPGSTMRLSSN